MDFLPAFLQLTNQPCLVVGGGAVSARKVALLLDAGAKVTVVAPALHPAFQEFAQRVTHRQKPFLPEDINGFFLVISATDNPALNADVAHHARNQNILINVVDNPGLSSFIFPAIIDRSPVVAAISTGGASPVLSRLLRNRLEALIPHQYGNLAKICGLFRTRVKQQIKNTDQRRRFWEKVLQGKVSELVFAGRQSEAETQLEIAIEAESNLEPAMGEVYLVGAGPGDPDLLTLKALRLIQNADVVVYDRLVSTEILSLVRRDAEMIYAGKEKNRHSMFQEEINTVLARLAKSGNRVVRLKGGDPFIFGRGGEEIETLMDQGISFQVVPGITAASGCASYAGIPLTHRDHAQSCVFVTGHAKDGIVKLDWKRLTLGCQTLVIYMGLTGLEQICRSLIEHGSRPGLPAALIQQGTTGNQRVITGNLSTLPGIVQSSNVKAPTLVIVGTVVSLHKKLAWFKTNV